LQDLAATRNPVVFSGDIHSFWSNDLRLGNRTVASEFVTSSVTSDGPPQDQLDGKRAAHAHIHFAESRRRGFSLVEIEGGRLTTHFRAIGDVSDPSSPVSTLAGFVLEDGRIGAAAV
jgi:alkaline phosphatase D